MSSLAAARADNFYYPPEWDPNNSSTSQQGVNKKAKHGSLGDRAKKMGEGILVIRFEMPFNVWCDGCNHLIAKGVRFNAEKRQVGNYFSTKIWSFKMRSPCCSTEIEVRTDPKICDYVVISGARRKVEEYDAEAAGTVVLRSAEEREAMLANPFARVENGEIDKAKALGERERMTALRVDNEDKHGNNYEANKALRRRHRAVRKEAKQLDAHRQALGINPAVKLLPLSKEDRLVASATQFDSDLKFRRNHAHARRMVQSQSIFANAASGKGYRPSKAATAPVKKGAAGVSKRSSNHDRLKLLSKRKHMEVSPMLSAPGK